MTLYAHPEKQSGEKIVIEGHDITCLKATPGNEVGTFFTTPTCSRMQQRRRLSGLLRAFGRSYMIIAPCDEGKQTTEAALLRFLELLQGGNGFTTHVGLFSII